MPSPPLYTPPWADPNSRFFNPLEAINWPPEPGTPLPELDSADPPAEGQPPQPRPLFFTTTAFAARLGVTVGTVRRMIRDGRVQATKFGRTTQSRFRIPATELDRLSGGFYPGGVQ